MAAKRKSLADRIKESQKQELSLADNFKLIKNKKQTPEHLDTLTPEQVPKQVSKHLDTLTPEQVPKHLDTLTPKHPSTLTPEHLDTLTPEHHPIIDVSKKPKNMKLTHFLILREVYFSRPFKVKGINRLGNSFNPPIPYGTVRYILNSLYKKGYISNIYSVSDGGYKGTTCRVSESKCVPLFGHSSIINSEQLNTSASEQLNTLTPEQFNTLAPEHLSTSNKIDRQIININLSISEFWKAQGLTDLKFQEWVKEFSFTQDEWETQLSFGEYEPKVTQAESPIKYFYRALQKGGVSRPAGFEFPEEKRLRIQQEETKRREDLLLLQEETRKKEQEIADRESFLIFLDDKEAVVDAVKEIEKQFLTPAMKVAIKNYSTTGKIDSRLETRLKQIFLSS